MSDDQEWVECVSGCGRRFLKKWLPYQNGKCSCGGDVQDFDMKAEIEATTKSYDLGYAYGRDRK